MNAPYRFGRFELNPTTRQLLADGQPVALGARALDVLLALIERRERLVTKDELLGLVWPTVVVEENNLQVQVSALRKALGVEAIATIPGRGYRFTLSLTGIEASASTPTPSPGDDLAGAPALKSYETGSTLDTTLRNVQTPDRYLSLVVLPFANRTGDPQQEYLADGITESLTMDLSSVRDAFIVDVGAAFSYKGKQLTAQQIGKDLDVRFVLQGSVQRTGDRIRINAHLADAASNRLLWSETFDGYQSDLFALQDQVTSRIGNSVGREIIIRAARESESRKISPQVSDLLLRARALNLQPQSLETLQGAEALYKKALSLEPSNPKVMVGLAGTLALQASNFSTVFSKSEVDIKFSEGLNLALMAKRIDPDDPGIYAVIGHHASHYGDLEGSQRAYEKRLALAPHQPSAFNNVGKCLILRGEPEKAIELLIKGVELNPKHPGANLTFNLGWAYFMLGDIEQAIDWLEKSLDQSPLYPNTHAYLAMAYTMKRQDAKARAEVAEVFRIDPNFGLSALAKTHPSTPVAFKEWREKQFLPAWRRAGLPE